MLHVLGWSSLLAGVAACQVELPGSVFRCDADYECPASMLCGEDRLCVRQPDWRVGAAGTAAVGGDHGSLVTPSPPLAGSTGTLLDSTTKAGTASVPVAGLAGAGLAIAGASGELAIAGASGELAIAVVGGSGGPIAGVGAAGPCANGMRPEQCDNQDNDCDGKVDETVIRPCGNIMGECKPGTETCQAGVWGSCQGAVEAGFEVCDADMKDENCDGTANENCGCTNGATKPCGNATSPCIQGTQTCAGGVWGTVCANAKGPTTENCDNIDDNCNGTIDDGAVCSGGTRCVQGQCVECTAASECPRVDCKTPSCVLGKCQQTNAARGTACGNNVCDGNGACVACNVPNDCLGKVKSDLCNTALCSSTGVCSSQLNNGASCGTGARCDTSGQCVASCGNGIIETSLGEECEPGNIGWETTCSSSCKQQIYGRPCTRDGDCLQPGGAYTGRVVCGAGNICVPTCMSTTSSGAAPADVCPVLPTRTATCAAPFCFVRCTLTSQCPAGTICSGSICEKPTGS